MTVTRFAPSPTGHLHIGNLRTALFNFALARQSPEGTFILRLDDTDPERSSEAYVEAIKADLAWLGLDWDRVERQSERLDRYTEAAERLRATGRLYECFETPEELELKRRKQLSMGRPPVYDRSALSLSPEEADRLRAERSSHWRFKLDTERIEWEDRILGPQSIDAASVSDPVLIRGDGQVLYTLASVVDDTEMGVTDVVRGADHVTNTATQIQIIRALGGRVPAFAHHSLLVGPDGGSLSKRLGTLALRDMRAEGVAPMALLSLMARLGASDPVVLRDSAAEVVAGFDITRFGAAPTKFDPADLRPLTARHVHALPYRDVAPRIAAAGVPDHLAERFWETVRENVETLDEVDGWWRIFAEGGEPVVAPEDAEFVDAAFARLSEPPYDATTWGDWTAEMREASGRKGRALFMPLRKAVTGRERGPEMAGVMELLQKKPARV